MMLFSFIIPVYNAEKTIKRCIESIVADIGEFENECEIITIDNGSTDQSRNLIVELKKKYSCIRLLESQKGVSRARNAGIKEAKGDKLIFIDADDIWLSGSLSIIFKLLSTEEVQLIQFAYYKNDSLVKHDIITDRVVSGADFDRYRAWMISQPTKRMQVWAKVFDHQVISKNNILFNENLSYSEDGDFVFRYMQNIKDMLVTNAPIYKYCQDSISTMRSNSNDKISGYKNSLEHTKMFLDNESAIVRKAFNIYILMHLNVIFVHDVFDVRHKVLFWKRRKWLLDIINMKIFRDALSSIRFKDCICINLLPELFLKYKLYSICGLLCMMKSKRNYKMYRF